MKGSPKESALIFDLLKILNNHIDFLRYDVLENTDRSEERKVAATLTYEFIHTNNRSDLLYVAAKTGRPALIKLLQDEYSNLDWKVITASAFDMPIFATQSFSVQGKNGFKKKTIPGYIACMIGDKGIGRSNPLLAAISRGQVEVGERALKAT